MVILVSVVMALVGGVMVLLLAEDGSGRSGVGGCAAFGAALQWLYHTAQFSFCKESSTYNTKGSLAKRGGSQDLSVSPWVVAATLVMLTLLLSK